MATLKLEYFLLPEDGSHLQEFLFRIKDDEGYSNWETGCIPSILFKRHSKDFVMTQFASKYQDEYSKYKAYECKIVRKKNVRRNKSKTA